MARTAATMPPAAAADAGPFSLTKIRVPTPTATAGAAATPNSPRDQTTPTHYASPRRRRVRGTHSLDVDRWARDMIAATISTAADADPSKHSNARSLIQMWRVKEAKELRVPVPVPTTPREAAVAAAAMAFGAAVAEKGGKVKVRSRKEMEELVERMRKERERELFALALSKRVSEFKHRGRIQVISFSNP